MSDNNANGAPKSIFGQTSGTSGSSNLFGGASGNSLFSPGNNNSAAASPFGSTGQNNTSSMFGGGGSAPNSATGTGFSFGTKAADNASGSQAQTPSLFGASATPAGSAAATPTANKTGFSFGGTASFTPAGPPPSNNMFSLGDTAKSTSSLFGNSAANKPTDSGSSASASANFFGQPSQQSSSQPSSLFGQGASNAFAKPAVPHQSTVETPTTSTPKANVFQFPSSTAGQGSAPQSATNAKAPAFSFPSSNAANSSAGGGTTTPSTEKPTLFGTTPSATPTATPQTSNIFGGSLEKKDGANNAATGNNMFGNLGGSKDSGQSAVPAASPFAAFNKQADTATPASASGGASLFANFGQKKDDTASLSNSATIFSPQAEKKDAQANAVPAKSPFGTFGQTAEKPAADAAKPSSTGTASAAPATAPAFGAAATKSTESSATQPLFGATSTKPAETAPTQASATAGPTSTLGASTTGPAPAPQSRLKNKSMDEIITRWSSDLSKYQKEFQVQAEKVAAWDRMLLDNGNAISKLYSKTFQAERDTAEVQKQLSAVESHQDELSQWLDRYEREVDDMMAKQVGQGSGLQGPDQERERT